MSGRGGVGDVDGEAVVVVLESEFAGVSEELDVFDFADAERCFARGI